MAVRRARGLTYLAFAGLAACGAPSSTRDAGDVAIPACDGYAEVDTYDPRAAMGCLARPTFEVCAVGDTVTCTNECTPEEYALECRGPRDGPIPEPVPSLGCRIIPVPTPPGASFYCCPCAP